MSLDDWMAEGAAVEADWPAHVTRLAMRGDLGHAGASLLLDLPALAAPYACQPHACTPGLRAPRTRSCCADLDVELSGREHAALVADLPAIAAYLAPRDARWADGPPTWSTQNLLARPKKRCVFAVLGAEGALSCGLHALEDESGRERGALKPLTCRLFPLLIVDLGGGQRLLTAVSRTNVKHGVPSPRWFPCLRVVERASTVAEETGNTLIELWGARKAREIRRQVRDYSV